MGKWGESSTVFAVAKRGKFFSNGFFMYCPGAPPAPRESHRTSGSGRDEEAQLAADMEEAMRMSLQDDEAIRMSLQDEEERQLAEALQASMESAALGARTNQFR